MRILATSKYVYSSYTFWNWGNNRRMGSGTYWTYCELYTSQNSVTILAPKAPTFTGGPQCFLGTPVISVHSEPVSSKPRKSDYFLSPSVQLKGSDPLGKNWRKANCKTFSYLIGVLPQGNLATPSFRRFWFCTQAQVWKSIHWTTLSFAMIQCSRSFP